MKERKYGIAHCSSCGRDDAISVDSYTVCCGKTMCFGKGDNIAVLVNEEVAFYLCCWGMDRGDNAIEKHHPGARATHEMNLR